MKVTTRNWSAATRYSSFHVKKRVADERAKKLRKMGYSVRVVALKSGYGLIVGHRGG